MSRVQFLKKGKKEKTTYKSLLKGNIWQSSHNSITIELSCCMQLQLSNLSVTQDSTNLKLSNGLQKKTLNQLQSLILSQKCLKKMKSTQVLMDILKISFKVDILERAKSSTQFLLTLKVNLDFWSWILKRKLLRVLTKL